MSLGHGDAVIASQGTPYFVCVIGGVGENSGKWYMVTFPADRGAIETELLKRKSSHPYKDARTRNWRLEQVAELTRENAEHPEMLRQ